MNTIVNDKVLSLATHTNPSKESKISKEPNAREETTDATSAAARQNTGKDDSLELSPTGQLLHQSATTKTETLRSAPETQDEAKDLLARIRQQFDQKGSDALSAHSAINASQTDLLLRSVAA